MTDFEQFIRADQANRWYVLCCNECDKETGVTPLPFLSQRERGRWASAHTKATGHNDWAVLTQNKGQPFSEVYREYLVGRELLNRISNA